MSVSINKSVNQSILTEAKKAFDNDGRLDKKEAQQLKQLVNSSDLPADIKAGVNSFLDKAKDASSGFLGIFGRNISSKELGQIKQLTDSLGNNPLAKDLLKTLENSIPVKTKDSNVSGKYPQHNTEPSNSFFSKLFSKKSDEKNIATDLNSNAKSGSVLATDVRGTTYYPINTAMEGGAFAKFKEINLKNHTLEAFMRNPDSKDAFVAIAVDEHLIREGKLKWGENLRIPEMEQALGCKSPIVFRAVDTGSAFTGGQFDSQGNFKKSPKYDAKGFSAIDICAEHQGKFQDKTFGKLTLTKF